MLPRFALPSAEPSGNINLATKPKQVESWLSRLPYANVSEAASEMTDFIATCVRIRTTADRLEAVLDIVLPTSANLVESLREKSISDGLPLPPGRQQTVELCTRLLSEIGYACKLIVLERSGRKFQIFGGKPIDRHLYLLALTLKQILEVNLETHQNPPPGIWLDLHQTYSFALSCGLARTPPATYADGPSLETIYKSALLLVLADPFRIPRETLPPVKDLIAKLSQLLDLIPSHDLTRHGAVFAIAFDTDTPVVVLSRESDMEIEGWDMLVNSTQLVKHLSLLASQYAKEKSQTQRSKKNKISDLGHLELIHRLKLHWGGSVQRMGARHMRFDNSGFEVCFGFQHIHKQLSDASHEPPKALSPYVATPSIATCTLVNDSVGGIALAKERPYGFQLRIGELVSVRQGSMGDWGIGIVRWFRATHSGKAIFGLQLIAPRAVGTTLQHPDMDETIPGLLLPATPALRQGEMVLTQPGKLGIGDTVTLSSGQETYAIQLEKLADFTACIEAYHYRPT